MEKTDIAQGTVDVEVRGQWLEWPTCYGYWWMKTNPEAEPKMVCIQPAKDGHKITAWECSGIGRYYLDSIDDKRFQQVLPAKN